MEPTDQEYGDRRYEAKNLEGHFWSFSPSRFVATTGATAARAW